MLFRGQTLGKYRITAPLGSGGFGAVYLARDTWIDKDVAIKVPHRQNMNFGELLREPRLLAALDHPNIISITTAEKQDNVFFIVMEYVAGQTLEEVIAGSGGLDAAHTVYYASQIGRAIEHAHAQGVIHRDLRPANMLVSESGVLKVADFGTSRFLEIAAHGTTVIGSPPYMAPEQFEGKAVFASDIYSLGITMYQMLTAVLPYESPAPRDLDKLMSGALVRPAAPLQPRGAEGAQRHRDEGARAGAVHALPAGDRTAARPGARVRAGRPAGGGAAGTPRRGAPRPRPASPLAAGAATARRRAASARAATSRCTRGRTAARSAERFGSRSLANRAPPS